MLCGIQNMKKKDVKVKQGSDNIKVVHNKAIGTNYMHIREKRLKIGRWKRCS